MRRNKRVIEVMIMKNKIICFIVSLLSIICYPVSNNVYAECACEKKGQCSTRQITKEIKSNYELALEVWQGKWGNGEERKEKLTSAGYNYIEVQKEVEKLKPTILGKNETKNKTKKKKIGNFKITGYVATGNKTSSGTVPTVGRTVAMNNSQRKELGINYGDKIYIEGLGTYAVEDSGCAYGVVDVFCATVKGCYAITSYYDVYYE